MVCDAVLFGIHIPTIRKKCLHLQDTRSINREEDFPAPAEVRMQCTKLHGVTRNKTVMLILLHSIQSNVTYAHDTASISKTLRYFHVSESTAKNNK